MQYNSLMRAIRKTPHYAPLLGTVTLLYVNPRGFSFFSKSRNEGTPEEPTSTAMRKISELWKFDEYSRNALQDIVSSAKNMKSPSTSSEFMQQDSDSKDQNPADKSVINFISGMDKGVKAFLIDITGKSMMGTENQLIQSRSTSTDILDIIPSSVVDDKSKDTLRVLSSLGEKLISQFQSSTEKLTHPFLVNIGILRLAALKSANDEKSPDAVISKEEISEEFLAEAKYFLRYASDVYKECPYIASSDILLNCLDEGSNMSSSVKIPRHVVFLDHLTKNIVVCIRGTGSISDILTDLHYDPKPLRQSGGNNIFSKMIGHLHKSYGNSGAETVYAHRGMADSALALKEGVVKAICIGLSQYKNYGIILTGHSLGAGTACLLSSLINEDIEVRSTTYAFAPPPLISITEEVCPTSPFLNATFKKPVVHCFVNNNDVVTRASHNEFLKLLSAVSCVDKLPWSPKERILKLLKGYLTAEELIQVNIALKGSDVSDFHQYDGVELVIPGQIYWLIPKTRRSDMKLVVSTDKGQSCSEEYDIMKVDDSRKLFCASFLSGDSMVSDHLVTSYMNAMVNLRK